MTDFQKAIETMKERVCSILPDGIDAIYLYGSAVMGDFQLGWSDIDWICFTKAPLTVGQAQELLTLRQTLLENEPGNLYYRSFEGAFLSFSEFLLGQYTTVVYWGTSGERLTNQFELDAFSQYGLMNHGVLVSGTDVRAKLQQPTPAQLQAAVRKHYQIIRQYAVKTGPSLHSCGWLLDIARGIYTLRTGKVIAKTLAGEWALEHHLCPVETDLRMALAVRKNPLYYKKRLDVQIWLASLGDAIQQFADVLERELEKF